MQPLVSVVIPTYNREAIVGRAVESALAQTYRNLEVIVVDDGSRDGTLRYLQAFKDRVKVVQQENAGPSAARNRGISLATGDIIAFLDSDDTWMPTKVERQVNLLEKYGKGVPCCLCNILLPHKPYGRETSFAVSDLYPAAEEGKWRNPAEVLLTRFVLFNQAVAVRKEALEKVGFFNSSLRLLEDYDLALRLSVLGPWSFVKTPLVAYGVGQANSLSENVGPDRSIVPGIVLGILNAALRRDDFQRARLRRLALRRIRTLRLQMTAARAADGGVFKKGVGRILMGVLRFQDAAIRRSPLLPSMEISAS